MKDFNSSQVFFCLTKSYFSHNEDRRYAGWVEVQQFESNGIPPYHIAPILKGNAIKNANPFFFINKIGKE
jgi:hypothetical protein